MIDKNELCEKMISIYTDIGRCRIDVQVRYGEQHKPTQTVIPAKAGIQCFNRWMVDQTCPRLDGGSGMTNLDVLQDNQKRIHDIWNSQSPAVF
jgi:hypothetical protein